MAGANLSSHVFLSESENSLKYGNRLFSHDFLSSHPQSSPAILFTTSFTESGIRFSMVSPNPFAVFFEVFFRGLDTFVEGVFWDSCGI